MRKTWTGVLAALALVLTATSLVSAAGGDPFTKSWSRVDVDGSRETLSFSGSGDEKTFAYRDDRATSCGGDPFEASGSVAVNGNTATFDGSGGCVGGPSALFGGQWVFDSASGTIDDGSGHLWHRGNGAREAFSGVWKATDIDGSAMKLTFKGSGLSRAVTYTDDLATSCDPDAVWKAAGTGTIGSTPGQGRYIRVAMEGGCIGQGQIDYDEAYRYDVETDTLRGPLNLDGSEHSGTVDWHRG